jgi:hypothetical protein
MVILDASNGGASGRPCAKAAAKFPAITREAKAARAALLQNFQTITVLHKFQGFNSQSGKAYFYTFPRTIQT